MVGVGGCARRGERERAKGSARASVLRKGVVAFSVARREKPFSCEREKAATEHTRCPAWLTRPVLPEMAAVASGVVCCSCVGLGALYRWRQQQTRRGNQRQRYLPVKQSLDRMEEDDEDFEDDEEPVVEEEEEEEVDVRAHRLACCLVSPIARVRRAYESHRCVLGCPLCRTCWTCQGLARQAGFPVRIPYFRYKVRRARVRRRPGGRAPPRCPQRAQIGWTR